MKIDDMRREFTRAGLVEGDLAADPIDQFARWFKDARDASPGDWFEPNAMTLATASLGGEPGARIMLLKSFDERGFSFYSNYESDKASALAENPRAALVFYWPMLERQVRITGAVEKLSREESEAYFNSRPMGSRIGAIASRQSKVIVSRQALEEKVNELAARYAGQDPPMPERWGGYLLSPREVEFWQGRVSRLHDRLRYRRSSSGSWIVERLSP
jgi:pyridoxamine 5'-phosphate oxidase